MPWENNGGGGGRNNNGGPWGQALGGGNNPRRPGGGNTPSLEDILNRGRDQFRGGVPGGRWALIGGALAIVAFWALNRTWIPRHPVWATAVVVLVVWAHVAGWRSGYQPKPLPATTEGV